MAKKKKDEPQAKAAQAYEKLGAAQTDESELRSSLMEGPEVETPAAKKAERRLAKKYAKAAALLAARAEKLAAILGA